MFEQFNEVFHISRPCRNYHGFPTVSGCVGHLGWHLGVLTQGHGCLWKLSPFANTFPASSTVPSPCAKSSSTTSHHMPEPSTDSIDPKRRKIYEIRQAQNVSILTFKFLKSLLPLIQRKNGKLIGLQKWEVLIKKSKPGTGTLSKLSTNCAWQMPRLGGSDTQQDSQVWLLQWQQTEGVMADGTSKSIPAPILPHRFPAHVPQKRDLLMHNHHLVLLPSLFLFLWNQISMVHFGNGFLGLTLLWINRYTSDLAFNILKSWGTAQRAALCPTWALCNLQVAACSARKASGSVFLSCPWKLFVDALLALAALSRRQEGAAAAGNVSSWCKQALKLFPSYLRGSEIQHPFIPIWFGHQEAWKIIT